MTAVPEALASALVTAGTSFAGESATVNVVVVVLVPEGVAGDELPQPAVRTPSATTSTKNRFIAVLPSLICLEEFPSEVEAEIETVREAAARDLAQGRPLSVVDVQLEQMT